MPRAKRNKAQVRDRLADLPSRARAELVCLWRKELACDPPRQMSRVMMMRILAYELQAGLHGRLSRNESRKLERAAAGQAVRPGNAQLSRGAQLVREWNGVTHIVEIIDDKTYRWRDKNYRSLSAIARAITGAHWSGPRFFGLNDRKRAA